MFQIRWGVILCHLAGQGLGAFGRRRRSQRSRRKKEQKSKTFQQEREVSLKQFGPHIFHASSSQPSWKCFGRLCVRSSILMLAVSKWSQIMCDGTSKATGHFQLSLIFCENSSYRRGVDSQTLTVLDVLFLLFLAGMARCTTVASQHGP